MKKLLLILFVLTACQQVPADPLPTYTAPAPLPSLEPLPTLVSLPTYTSQPTLEPLPTYTMVPTEVSPTAEPTEILPTAAPSIGYVKVLGTVSKLLLREVCWNTNGFIYNGAGFPIMSDCIYPLKGEVADRIRYSTGDKIEVELFGDDIFAALHGFHTHGSFGKATVKADGGERYYVATQRGANGELLFVAAWLVKVIN